MAKFGESLLLERFADDLDGEPIKYRCCVVWRDMIGSCQTVLEPVKRKFTHKMSLMNYTRKNRSQNTVSSSWKTHLQCTLCKTRYLVEVMNLNNDSVSITNLRRCLS